MRFRTKHLLPGSLRAKIVGLAALLAVGPALVVGLLRLQIQEDALRSSGRELQLALLQDLAESVERSFERGGSELDAVAQTLTRASLPDDARIELAMTVVESSHILDHLDIFDQHGQLIDQIRHAGYEQSAPPQLSPALRSGALEEGRAWGDVTRTTSDLRIRTVIPLIVKQQLTGFVSSELSLRPMQERLDFLSHNHFIGFPSGLTVLDENARVIAAVDRDRWLQSAAHDPFVADISLPELPPEIGIAREIDNTKSNIGQVGTLLRLRSLPWIIVAQVPTPIAYAELYEERERLTLYLGVIIFFALVLGTLFARHISVPLSGLSQMAARLAERRFDHTSLLERRDELGTLARAMEQAAFDLAQNERQIRREAEVRRDLGRYMPAQLVENILSRRQDMRLGGRRQTVTVLFADIVQFTPLTRQHDPEVIVEVLNELFTILTGIIFRHGGMVDKFVGDCVMAIWGATADNDDQATLALRAAQDMQNWLDIGNRPWFERFGIRLELAIGVHTGSAIVGNIGSEMRMDFTAIGETVNVAARLESIARPRQILTSSATINAASSEFTYRSVGHGQALGSDDRMELFEVDL